MFKYAVVRDVQDPTRANPTDAGLDFFVPTSLTKEDLIKKNPHYMMWSWYGSYIRINAHGRILIPSGVHVNLEPNRALIAFNKSGVASKKGLIVGSCVVDEGYQGEMHLSLLNTNDHDVDIKLGEKIVQFIYVPIDTSLPEKVAFEHLYSTQSSRGEGGFGSSGV